jgi:hypothetical protein
VGVVDSAAFLFGYLVYQPWVLLLGWPALVVLSIVQVVLVRRVRRRGASLVATVISTALALVSAIGLAIAFGAISAESSWRGWRWDLFVDTLWPTYVGFAIPQLLLVLRPKSNWVVAALTLFSAASASTFALILLALAPLNGSDVAWYVLLTPGVVGVLAV